MTIYKVTLKNTVKYQGVKHMGGSSLVVTTEEDANLFKQLGHNVVEDDVIDAEFKEDKDESGDDGDDDDKDILLSRDEIKEELDRLEVSYKGNAKTSDLLKLLNDSANK